MLLDAYERPHRIIFDAKPVMGDDQLAPHIRRALLADLPGSMPGALPTTLRVIANGPSALLAPLDGPTIALNGSLGMMLRRGVAPTFWAACDPQELVTEFLDVMPADTIYLVATKCHPKVFERLAHRQVCRWHLDEGVGPRGIAHSTTITLTSMNLMRACGWRRFEVWGWDGCYLGGKHHANETHNVPDGIDCHIGGRVFRSTPAWACEAEEAGQLLQSADYEWTIKGDGMIAAYVDALGL